MNFIGTRGGGKVSFFRAVISGIPADCGLYVPEKFPNVTALQLENMLEASYPERAAFIVSAFSDDLDREELLSECEKAYSSFKGDPAPLVKLDDGIYMLELWHGPTCSYKDFSLSLFPYLLRKSFESCGLESKALILAATAGDTGTAAIEAFKNSENAKVFAFYPHEGVTKMQKLHLSAQDGENICVSAVRGSFDECLSFEKHILSDGKFFEELQNSGFTPVSANSLNAGVLVPRIAYFFSAYLDLVSGGQIELGEEIDFTLPAGNFGNAVAAYYAKLMGLPVRRIHCASSLNSALPDFLTSGVCDLRREFNKTTAPSLDVVNPSDLERLIFEVSHRNAALTADRMERLKKEEKYEVSPEELGEIGKIFDGGYASEETSVEAMYSVFMDVGYTMDTSTGYAMKVALDWFEKNKKDETKMVVLSTANPYKCPQDVLYAVTGNDVKDSFKGVKRLHAATAMAVPKCISELRNKEPRFTGSCDLKKLYAEILDFAK